MDQHHYRNVVLTSTNNDVMRGTLTTMPNWVFNSLTVSGDQKALDKFKKKARTRSSAFSFNKFIPMPDELKDTRSPATYISEEAYDVALDKYEKNKKKRKPDQFIAKPITQKMSEEYKEKFGADNWYEWQLANYGTKWDVHGEVSDKGENFIEYIFDSAWSPPLKALITIGQANPKLNFEMVYHEPGMMFRGKIIIENGEITQYDEWDMTDADMEELGYDTSESRRCQAQVGDDWCGKEAVADGVYCEEHFEEFKE